MIQYADAARRTVDILGEPAARDLLQLLDSVDAIRADAFRQFHERGGQEAVPDALTDLEAEPVMRGWLVEYLKMELGKYG